jgi:hypothetical protein
MTKSYNLVFLEDNYNITNYKYDNYNQILYSLRNGDDFIIKNIENILALENQIKDSLLFIPDVLKSGFYSLEEIKNYLDKEKIGINYPTNFIEFFDILDDNYSYLSNLIFLEYIYNKMIKNNYKIVHIIYE